ncbi:MAG: hypothetical protein M1823_005918 [Watsoniomyces obsoletus]|nr:MAG: hypothetical protein M1823_005918 [Watsoniomyces obsoletus]
MADSSADGLLLNFAVSTNDIKVKPKFKGGRWRDRLVAKRSSFRSTPRQRGLQGEQKNDDTIGKSTATEATKNRVDDVGTPATKRRRLDADPELASTSRTGAQSNGEGPKKTVPRGNRTQREFVSSLFSSNPLPETAQEKEVEETAPAEPSNAPLASEASSFMRLGLSSIVTSNLSSKLKLKAPTAIQKAAIPQLLRDDSDAFIQAETGSGKTLAYLLPIVQRIINHTGLVEAKNGDEQSSKLHRDSGLFAMILAPTRELCRQISVVLEDILRWCAHWIVSGTVVGGEKKKSEKARIRKGLNILVATPGRLADHLENTKVLDVSNVRWLVLDEGDRLMEMGFEADIEKIISKLEERRRERKDGTILPAGFPRRRVTVLCSATMNMSVQKLGGISLNSAAHIKADPEEEETSKGADATERTTTFSTPAQLQQSYTIVPAKLRLVTLTAVLRRAFHRRGSVMKSIVFISCADSVDFHFTLFTRRESRDDADEDEKIKPLDDSVDPTLGTIATSSTLATGDSSVTVYKLHGSLTQQIRTATLKAFTQSKDPSVLICTDVASRGLDLPNIDFVIEYDPPFSKDDHLHRVGRTARAGRAGRTLIFLLPGSEEGYVDVLKAAHHDGGRAPSRSDSNDLLKKGFGSAGLGGGNDWETRATDWQMDLERWLLKNPKALEMARKAFQSQIRAYATHVANERAIFDIKSLHLGHLAKSFGLREPPGNIGVPGLKRRSNYTKDHTSSGKDREGTKRGRHERDNDDQQPQKDVTEDQGAGAAIKMRKKMREHMMAASEFNIS